MSDFTFNCPQCDQSIEVSADFLSQIIECPSCNGLIELPSPEPTQMPQSNEPPAQVEPEPRSLPINRAPQFVSPAVTVSLSMRQIIGIIGAIILFVGVFAPIVSVPIMGNMNYFQNGKGDGTIVLVLAVLSLLAILAKKDILLFFTSLGCLATLTFTFVNFKIGMNRLVADAGNADDMFSGLAELAVQAVQLQWGWALLVVGAGLTLAPLFLRYGPEDTSHQGGFGLAAGWRITAGAICGLCFVAVVAALVWPTATEPTAASSSTEPEPTGLQNVLSSETKEPDDPPKQIPTIRIGSSVVIDDVRITIRGIRRDYIHKKFMFGDSTTRSDDKYLLVDVTLQNTSRGKIIYLQQIWEHTKLVDNFDNAEGAEFSRSFRTESIVGYLGSAKMKPGETMEDIIIFDLPVDTATGFTIESDPKFWKSIGEKQVRELSDSSFKIKFRRSEIDKQRRSVELSEPEKSPKVVVEHQEPAQVVSHADQDGEDPKPVSDKQPLSIKTLSRADKILVLLRETPEDKTVLARLSAEIPNITDANTQCRLSVIHCLGCLYTHQNTKATSIRKDLTKKYPTQSDLKYLSRTRLFDECPTCQGNKSIQVACPECGGTGECSWCRGRGSRTVATFSGTQQQDCAWCKTTGTCARCSGAGKLTRKCSVCNGKGSKLSRDKVKETYLSLLRESGTSG